MLQARDVLEGISWAEGEARKQSSIFTLYAVDDRGDNVGMVGIVWGFGGATVRVAAILDGSANVGHWVHRSRVARSSSKECRMLFHSTWEFRDNSEEAIQRSLGFFSQWQPPDGFEFKGFWGYADGSGGVAIIEADSAAAIARATAPFAPWLVFSTTPILPVEESAAIAGEAVAARAAFKG